MVPTRGEAFELLKKHNKDEGHIKHAVAVEGAMRHFARKMGGDEDLWGVVGILHDIDWEKTMNDPTRHCNLAPELLREAGYTFEVRPSGVPEPAYRGGDPALYAESLARAKAAGAAAGARAGRPLAGALARCSGPG